LSKGFPDALRDWIEVLAHCLLIVPICSYLVWFTSGMFWISMLQNEGPPDVVVGLPRWVLIAFMPIGFTLLGLQAVSEAAKGLLRINGIEPRRIATYGLDLSQSGRTGA
jgi:TRAP-type mannitol/chloroaromatic compound transport system permease small subunit